MDNISQIREGKDFFIDPEHKEDLKEEKTQKRVSFFSQRPEWSSESKFQRTKREDSQMKEKILPFKQEGRMINLQQLKERRKNSYNYQ